RARGFLGGAVTLSTDLARLDAEEDSDADEQGEDADGRNERRPMTRNELANLVRGARRMRQDRPVLEGSLDVFGEGVGARVSLVWFLLQRFSRDRPEVRIELVAALERLLEGLRRLVDDDLQHAHQRARFDVVGEATRDRLVQRHTERIDVAAQIDLPAVAA